MQGAFGRSPCVRGQLLSSWTWGPHTYIHSTETTSGWGLVSVLYQWRWQKHSTCLPFSWAVTKYLFPTTWLVDAFIQEQKLTEMYLVPSNFMWRFHCVILSFCVQVSSQFEKTLTYKWFAPKHTKKIFRFAHIASAISVLFGLFTSTTSAAFMKLCKSQSWDRAVRGHERENQKQFLHKMWSNFSKFTDGWWCVWCTALSIMHGDSTHSAKLHMQEQARGDQSGWERDTVHPIKRPSDIKMILRLLFDGKVVPRCCFNWCFHNVKYSVQCLPCAHYMYIIYFFPT